MQKILIYTGKFGEKVRLLRKVSLGSSIISLTLLPAAFLLDSGVMGTGGQIAVASSVAFSSLSSTAMLQLVAKPYVYALYEDKGNTVQKERHFYAEKVDFFGRVKGFPFLLSEVDKKPSHPFASFKLSSTGENFYVFGEGLDDDPELRKSLCKD